MTASSHSNTSVPNGVTRLTAGDIAPDFTLPDQDGNTVALRSLQGTKVILFVYPAALTPGCTREACDFRDSLHDFHAAGYTILGLSKDPVDKQRRFDDAHGFGYPVLSDPDRAVLAAYGAYGPKRSYGRETVGVIRSTFVIDETGRIVLAKYNVKATGHVTSLRRQLGLTPPAQ